MSRRHPQLWTDGGSEVRGIAVLRVALVPVALWSQHTHRDFSFGLFPWVLAAVGVYAIGSLIASFRGSEDGRVSLASSVVDLCAVGLLVYTSGGEDSPLKFAFYVLPIGAALRLSPRLTASWAVLSVLTYLAVTLPHPDTVLPRDLGLVFVDSLSLLWVSSAAVMLSAMIGRRQRAVVDFAERRRGFVQQALNVEAREQRRLADALHDEAVQNVLFARQELTDIARGVPGAEARARAALDDTDRQLRHEIFAMHPLGLERAGVAAVLRSLAENAERRGGFTTTLHVDPRAEQGGHHDLLVATARELLGNIAKHARAQRVDVRLYVEGEHLILTVADDGHGIETGREEQALNDGHIGLAATRERIWSRSGRLEIDTGPANGTTVRVTLPRERPADAIDPHNLLAAPVRGDDPDLEN